MTREEDRSWKLRRPQLIYCRNNYIAKRARATEEERKKQSKDAETAKKERNSVRSWAQNPLTEDVNICLAEPFETDHQIQLSFAML